MGEFIIAGVVTVVGIKIWNEKLEGVVSEMLKKYSEKQNGQNNKVIFVDPR